MPGAKKMKIARENSKIILIYNPLIHKGGNLGEKEITNESTNIKSTGDTVLQNSRLGPIINPGTKNTN